MQRAFERATDRTDGGSRPRSIIQPVVASLPTAGLGEEATRYERHVKPIFDRVIAAVLVAVLAPVLGMIALLVRLELGPGIIYRQYRVGHRGALFQMYKFRTMEPDRRREPTGEVRPDRRSDRARRTVQLAVDGTDLRQAGDRRRVDIGRRRTHKSANDPRHTRLGRFLRASSLDELPQLFNVLKGELSLVGPRPELPEVVAGYESWEHERHRVKPGITGLWQVTERADEKPMHQHVDTDLQYVNHLSAGMDARILLLTVPVLLGLGRGGRGS